MKKYLCVVLFAILSFALEAENVLHVMPFTTQKGVTLDPLSDASPMVISMNNAKTLTGIQFDILLPEGIEIVENGISPYMNNDLTPSTNRLPYTMGKWGPVFKHTIDMKTQSDGYERVMISSNDNTEINGTSGQLLEIFFSTASNMPSGVYPIYIKEVTLTVSGSEELETASFTSSYVVIDNDGNSNPLETAAHVDLSGMTGYIPSFVVNQLNTDIASNESLKSLNLSGTSFENLGAALNVPNNNDLLWYTSDKASLNRTFTAGNWSTVCLPFTLETITVNTLLTNGCVVKGMTSYKSSEKTVTFDDVNTMSTGVPYLFKCSDLKTKPFENIDITNPEAISTGPHNVTDNNLTFIGTYELATPSSTGSRTIYGYKDNQFVKVESGSGKVQPFRAYMELAGGVGTRGFISIDGLDDATGINEIVVPDAEKTTPIYDLQGRKVDGNYHSRGILIQNGKKIIKK